MRDIINKNDIPDAMGSSDDYVRVSKITRSSTEHIIHFYTGFPGTKELGEILNVLDTAGDYDSITFKIGENYGGSIECGIKLINNIMTCRVPIKVIVDSTCYSMASLFVVAMFNLGHPVTLMPNTFLMFHDYSGAHFGKGGEIKTQAEHTREWTRDLFTSYCYPFLTRGEINKMIKGQDFYISQKDAGDRLAKIMAKKKKK